MKDGPLAPFVVVDLSRILAGPFAAQLLADLGAIVHKVEPVGGDPTRAWGPPFDRGNHGESAYFQCANRGKTTEELDLRSAAGRRRLDELLRGADVVVENFLPRSARDLGLAPAELRAAYPRLVVASIRSFAGDTDARERAGYDFLLQAESGWMSITGEVDGPPSKVGVALVDVLAGLYLANGIQAALLERERTGVGRHVEVPLMEAALAGLINVGAGALMTGETPRRFGNGHPNIVPYQSFSCRDGAVALAVGNDRQFAALMEGLGLAGRLAERPGWRTNPGRVGDRQAVISAIAGACAERTVDDVLAVCSSRDVAAGPVRDVSDALAQEGTLHRAVRSIPDPGAPSGEVRVVGSPLLVDGERIGGQASPPPRRTGRQEG